MHHILALSTSYSPSVASLHSSSSLSLTANLIGQCNNAPENTFELHYTEGAGKRAVVTGQPLISRLFIAIKSSVFFTETYCNIWPLLEYCLYRQNMTPLSGNTTLLVRQYTERIDTYCDFEGVTTA